MQNGDLYVERRRHKRAQKKCRVNYKLIMADDEAETIKKSASRATGESEDISVGGSKIEGDMQGESGDIVRLEVIIEGRAEPVVTFAEVKWVAPAKNNFGVEFLILKDGDKQAIEEILG
jgi:hypothetical protein